MRSPAKFSNDPLANACIYFHDDGYDPNSKELNGRRIAGESFLRGYIEHGSQERLCAVVDSPRQSGAFVEAARKLGFEGDIATRISTKPGLPNQLGSLFLPGPGLARYAWMRCHNGGPLYSLCGITHTTATKRVTEGFFDLGAAPVYEHDAVICTSQAVRSSVQYQMDLQDQHFKDRFGLVAPKPLFPVIPLGIRTEDFRHNANSRKKWREKLGIDETDIAVITVSRLNAFGKFDPLPMFQALELAAKETDFKIHFVAIGPMSDNISKSVFAQSAKYFAPSILYHHVDGTKVEDAKGLWSAGDIFTHPVDNIQETFGLAPVEAMAAGLPVVVTDWDGFKDTVTQDVGFKIKTLGPKQGSLRLMSQRYSSGIDNYTQYMTLAAQQTAFDIREMAEVFSKLFHSRDLRKKLGENGIKRALEIYDWSKVIPLYQELWKEQSNRRQASLTNPQEPAKNTPFMPEAAELFASYPSEPYAFEKCAFDAISEEPAEKIILKIVEVRALNKANRRTVSDETLVTVLEAIQNSNATKYESLIPLSNVGTGSILDRALIWLIKYNLIQITYK